MSNIKRKSTETVVDVANIEDASDKIITDILRSRFSSYNVYTNIGSCNLIAVNPFKQLAVNDAQTSEDYVTSYKNVTAENPLSNKLNPHIFDLTNRAYFHMRRTGSDQAIFLW
jgi:chitin synthase